MKIAITGALGHIGSKLIRTLPVSFPGCQLVLIDNLSSERYCSLFDLPANGNYQFVEADVITADLNSLFSGVDVVIHLAAITNALGSFDTPEKVEHQNFNATKQVAEACLKKGIKLLYFSTTSVYGTENATVSENCSKEDLKPQSPYAATKLKEEDFLRKQASRMPLTICRLGTIFGTSPGMRFHTAVNKFCWQAVMGQPITVWKSALKQVRPYLDLKDATKAVEFILNKNLFSGETYNLLTLNTTVEQIVASIRMHLPRVNVKLVDSKAMNEYSYEVERKKFEKLGFQFSGDLKAGVADTLHLLERSNTSASRTATLKAA